MTSISQNVNVDELNDIVSEYNNTYYKTIQMKPIDFQNSTYFDPIKVANDKEY